MKRHDTVMLGRLEANFNALARATSGREAGKEAMGPGVARRLGLCYARARDVAESTSELAARLAGREAELTLLAEFLGTGGAARGFVLTGGPGIGKTSLWEAGVDLARKQGLRVLSARGSGAETRLSFAALIDLLDGVGPDELAGLAPPQRQALEVALFRAESTGEPPEATRSRSAS